MLRSRLIRKDISRSSNTFSKLGLWCNFFFGPLASLCLLNFFNKIPVKIVKLYSAKFSTQIVRTPNLKFSSKMPNLDPQSCITHVADCLSLSDLYLEIWLGTGWVWVHLYSRRLRREVLPGMSDGAEVQGLVLFHSNPGTSKRRSSTSSSFAWFPFRRVPGETLKCYAPFAVLCLLYGGPYCGERAAHSFCSHH